MTHKIIEYGTAAKLEKTHPELKLIYAVLERAIKDYFAGTIYHSTFGRTSPKFISKEASEWIFSDYEYPPAWSYQWVCEILDVDYQKIRRWIVKQDQHFIRGTRTGDEYGNVLVEAILESFKW